MALTMDDLDKMTLEYMKKPLLDNVFSESSFYRTIRRGTANRDMTAGEIVMADGRPVGVAMNSAKAGGPLDIQVNGLARVMAVTETDYATRLPERVEPDIVQTDFDRQISFTD